MSLFSGCALSNRWSASHPSYTKKPSPNESIGFIVAENAFILTRSKWFSNRLNVPMDSIHQKTDELISSTFKSTLKEHYPKLKTIPTAVQNTLPEESQKLDRVVFIKGRFPSQGMEIATESGEKPPYLLILHEFIIGTDLKRSIYFDYTQNQQEFEFQSLVKNVTVIASYTLWDNFNQRPLLSSIIEIQHPFANDLTMNNLKILAQKAAKQIEREIREKVHQ